MKNFIKETTKLIIVICVTIGAFLTVKNEFKGNSKDIPKNALKGKSLQLKKYLLENQKPQRVEIVSYTTRYAKDVEEIKKLKIPQDPKSNFYVTIQFFTDESDSAAPMIAQIRFIDIKSSNLIKEESLNLE